MKTLIGIISITVLTLLTNVSAYAAHPMCKPIEIIKIILCS